MRCDDECIQRVARWLDRPIAKPQVDALSRFAAWLGSEALAAGGLGPAEGSRIWDRHICDSLTFASAWDKGDEPTTAIDVGSGVGLPGLPLAILWPDTEWTLLDRSERRTSLVRRAIRVIGVSNAAVITGQLERHAGRYEGAVARAVAAPDELAPALTRLLLPGGRAVIGLSRAPELTSQITHPAETRTIPSEVLDGGAKILIIEACER